MQHVGRPLPQLQLIHAVAQSGAEWAGSQWDSGLSPSCGPKYGKWAVGRSTAMVPLSKVENPQMLKAPVQDRLLALTPLVHVHG